MSSHFPKGTELRQGGMTFPLELELEEDLEAEIHHFVKLSRMGNYTQAHEFYDHTLHKHDHIFPIIAEYADMLLEQGCYTRATEYLQWHIATKRHALEADELQLLRLMKSWAGIYSKGALRPALLEAKRAHDILRSNVIQMLADLPGDVQIHIIEIYANIIIFGLQMSEWVDETWVFCPVFCRTSQAEHGFVQWFCILKENGMFWEAARILRCILPIMPLLSDRDLRLLLSNGSPTLDLPVPQLWGVLVLTVHQAHYLLNAALSARPIHHDTPNSEELYEMCGSKLELGQQILKMCSTGSSVLWNPQLALETISYETVGRMLFTQSADFQPFATLSAILFEADLRQDFRTEIHARLYLLLYSDLTLMDWRDLYCIFELYQMDGNLVEHLQTWGLFASWVVNFALSVDTGDSSNRFRLLMFQHTRRAASDLKCLYLLQERFPLPVRQRLSLDLSFDRFTGGYPFEFDIPLYQMSHSPHWDALLFRLDEKTRERRPLPGETPASLGAEIQSRRLVAKKTAAPIAGEDSMVFYSGKHKSSQSVAESREETMMHAKAPASIHRHEYHDPELEQSQEPLDANILLKALQALDTEIGYHAALHPVSPIKLISTGGFLAINFLKTQDTTKDLNFLLDPEWAIKGGIKKGLEQAILNVQKSFQLKQNVILFQGDHLTIFAAPIKWAVKQKIRSILSGRRDQNTETGWSDLLAMLKYIRGRKGSPLNPERLCTQRFRLFEVLPYNWRAEMENIAAAYREEYNEEIFA
ncbi:hypothetical protein BJX76DRAFT_360112 [Aspergillus varians]